MIAKLVTHAPSRAAAIEAQADALDAFYIDGIRHNIPFLAGADAASALARGQSFHRLHRRGVSRRLCARAPEGEIARRLAAVAAAIDHVLGERKRQISGQMIGAVQRERRRAVWLGGEEIALDVIAKPMHRGPLVFEDGSPATHLSLDWKPGIRSGRARSTASRWRCRCARSPTASGLRIRALR